MKDEKFIKKRNNNKKITLTKFLLVLCFGYFVVTFTIQQFKINEYRVKEDYYIEQISEVTDKTVEYKEITSQVKDIEYIENVARDSLGLVKPYEKIFVDVNK